MRYYKIEINHEKIAQLASRARCIKYFLNMPVHAASSERSCENAHVYRLDLAFAARMYVKLSRPQRFVYLLTASGRF